MIKSFIYITVVQNRKRNENRRVALSCRKDDICFWDICGKMNKGKILLDNIQTIA